MPFGVVSMKNSWIENPARYGGRLEELLDRHLDCILRYQELTGRLRAHLDGKPGEAGMDDLQREETHISTEMDAARNDLRPLLQEWPGVPEADRKGLLAGRIGVILAEIESASLAIKAKSKGTCATIPPAQAAEDLRCLYR